MSPGASRPRPYADPYLAGVGLGLVLLAAFVFAGRGLGASGAFGRVAAEAVAVVAPEHAAARAPLAGYLADGGAPPGTSRAPGAGGAVDAPGAGAGAAGRLAPSTWLVVEMLGVLVGGFASAFLAGRFRPGVTRGHGVGVRSRLALAGGGGVAMGVGALLARGCTSGLALTGGALLAPGAWIFIASAFGAGYVAAPLVRGAWR